MIVFIYRFHFIDILNIDTIVFGILNIDSFY